MFDLVYVPLEDERVDIDHIDPKRIYKCISFTGRQCLFLPYSTASVILQKVEFEALNKMERAITGEMIKEICIPVTVDRLGNVKQIG